MSGRRSVMLPVKTKGFLNIEAGKQIEKGKDESETTALS
jgi:hypothetical protein